MVRADRLSLLPLLKERFPLSISPHSPKVTRNSLLMEDDVWVGMKQAAQDLSVEARADGRKPFTRDQLIEHACKRWLEEWRAERATKRKR